MEQFMKRTLKRTRTEEEYYDLGEESIKRHKVESVTTPLLVPSFSTMPVSLPSPEEESNHEPVTITTTNQDAMLKSFVISTKKNTQYNQINDLLHQVHVMRYGDPELRERWWEQEQQKREQYNHHYHYQQQQHRQQDKEEIQMNGYIQQQQQQQQQQETETIYESANATLRQAFLQRHHRGAA